MVVAWAAAVFAQESPAILTPAHESVVAPGIVRLIGKTDGKAQALLDGKPVEVVSPAPGVVLGEIKVAEGAHELILRSEGGEARIRFAAGKEQDGWKMFRPHPPAPTACDACHAVRDGVWAMKRASLAPLCFTCHDKQKYPEVHTHNTDLLADCQNCHLPHGSAARSHLKLPKQTACRQCHSLP
ncbi:MAG: hypothetical protein HY235_11240 [Acidobacteria bacterium]|nr:hypothetical protein [Acidobacteriota bacterium]